MSMTTVLIAYYDKYLERYTVFFEGDDLVFDTWQEAEKFIKANQEEGEL